MADGAANPRDQEQAQQPDSTPAAAGDPHVGDRETFHELIKLHVKHDDMTRAWLRFLVTIEGALAVALWSVLRFGASKPWLSGGAAVAIVIVAVVTAWALIRIIHRTRRWEAWFSSRARDLQRQIGVEIYNEPAMVVRALARAARQPTAQAKREDAIKALKEALSDAPDSEITLYAAKALGEFKTGDREAAAALRSRLECLGNAVAQESSAGEQPDGDGANNENPPRPGRCRRWCKRWCKRWRDWWQRRIKGWREWWPHRLERWLGKRFHDGQTKATLNEAMLRYDLIRALVRVAPDEAVDALCQPDLNAGLLKAWDRRPYHWSPKFNSMVQIVCAFLVGMVILGVVGVCQLVVDGSKAVDVDKIGVKVERQDGGAHITMDIPMQLLEPTTQQAEGK